MAAYMINKNNFQEEVLQERGTVVIDFFAPWCMPCKKMSPVVDKIAQTDTDFRDRPLEDQKIRSITVETFGVDYPEPDKM